MVIVAYIYILDLHMKILIRLTLGGIELMEVLKNIFIFSLPYNYGRNAQLPFL